MIKLGKLKGSKATLVVNVASHWKYTDVDYKQMVALWNKYHKKGL